MKSTFELLKYRTEYYKNVITAALLSIGVSIEKLKFTTGSSYQLTPEFTLDILKLCTLCSEHDAKRAGAEVVKQTSSAPLSGLLYPIYQWLDEEYALHVHASLSSVADQVFCAGTLAWMRSLVALISARFSCQQRSTFQRLGKCNGTLCCQNQGVKDEGLSGTNRERT